MLPTFKDGQIVLCHRLLRQLKVGDIVVIKHQGIEKIKRLSKINQHSVEVLGDNLNESTDSRVFGTLLKSKVIATVIHFRRR